jgi:hypothetical protein
LNQDLSFTDNFNAITKTITLTVNASGTPSTTITIPTTTLGSAVSGILLINAVNQTNSAVYPTSAPFVSFTATSSAITITNITGLQANNSYNLTIVILGSS